LRVCDDSMEKTCRWNAKILYQKRTARFLQ
jgi:hypothetical protein